MIQKEKVLSIMTLTGYIENYKAFKSGITDLQGRIRDLKNDGHKIYSDFVYKKNGTKYKLYTLKKRTLDEQIKRLSYEK